MEKVKMIFLNSEKSELETELTAHCTKNGEICINIQDPDDRPLSPYADIFLDVNTAEEFVLYLQRKITEAKKNKEQENIYLMRKTPAFRKINKK